MRTDRGFTLVELMIVVAIIAILAAIAIPMFANLIAKSQEGATKGNLGSIRGALQIYYGDNENAFPFDDLTSLIQNSKYLELMPAVNTPPYHSKNTNVTAEVAATDTGQWSYNNDSSDPHWGNVLVGCTHSDVSGRIWTTY